MKLNSGLNSSEQFTSAESLVGVSFLPRKTYEKFRNEAIDTPKTKKKYVNAFIERKILNCPEAAKVMFEKLSDNTSSVHKNELHNQLTDQERFQTFQTIKIERPIATSEGIRIRRQLGQENRSASHSKRLVNSQAMARRNQIRLQDQQATEPDEYKLEDIHHRTMQNFQPREKVLPKSVTRIKVTDTSLMGKTLGNFERGHTGKNMSSISGTDYYYKTIHNSQCRRLAKFIKNPAGIQPKMKNFIPLSEIEKPSVAGRVQQYMQKMGEEEQAKKRAAKMSNRLLSQGSIESGKKSIKQTQYGSATHKVEITEPDSTKSKPTFKGSNMRQRTIDLDASPNQKGSIRSIKVTGFNDMHPAAARKDSLGLPADMANSSLVAPPLSSTKMVSEKPSAGRISPLNPVKKPSKVHVTLGGGSINDSDKKPQQVDSEKKDITKFGKQMTFHNLIGENVSLVAKTGENVATKFSSLQPLSSQVTVNRGGQMSLNIGTSSPEASPSKPKTTAGKSKDKNRQSSEGKKNIFAGINVSWENIRFNQEQMAIYIITVLRKQNVFKDQEGAKESGSKMTITDEAAMAFGKMCTVIPPEMGEDGKVPPNLASTIRVARINETKLRKYFTKRYQGRLAYKMTNIFDWANLSEYHDLFRILNEVLLRPQDKNPELNHVGHLEILKTFAFHLFDYNCDNFVDQIDIFTMMNNVKGDDIFFKVLQYDFRDIQRTFENQREEIKVNDSVMDHHPDGTTTIRDLNKFLTQQDKRADDRRKVYVDVFAPSNVRSDPSFVPFFNRMLKRANLSNTRSPTFMTEPQQNKNTYEANSTTEPSGGGGQGATNKKRNFAKSGIENMLAGGLIHLKQVQQQSRKQSTSEIIKNVGRIMGSKETNPTLSQSDFCEKVNFTFGVPLIVLDFIDQVTGTKFIDELHTHMNPTRHVERFHPSTDYQLRQMKEEIHERFVFHIFCIFNALGAIKNLDQLGPNIPQEEKESRQYIDLKSLKENLPEVFGVKNDNFALMLFLYLSEHAPLDRKITYKQFLERFMVFWPKKEQTHYNETPEGRLFREAQERNLLNQQYRDFIFEFMKIQGLPTLNILDLLKLSVYFPAETKVYEGPPEARTHRTVKSAFGQEVHKLVDAYREFNIVPRYVFYRQEFNKATYQKYVGQSCLIDDFRNALVRRFPQRASDDPFDEDEMARNNGDAPPSYKLPETSWKIGSIVDERDLKETDYYKEIKEKEEQYCIDEIFEWQKARNHGDITDNCREQLRLNKL